MATTDPLRVGDTVFCALTCADCEHPSSLFKLQLIRHFIDHFGKPAIYFEHICLQCGRLFSACPNVENVSLFFKSCEYTLKIVV
jgi:hypothetical protein